MCKALHRYVVFGRGDIAHFTNEAPKLPEAKLMLLCGCGACQFLLDHGSASGISDSQHGFAPLAKAEAAQVGNAMLSHENACINTRRANRA